MAIQSREVYNTGTPAVDRILNRIAERLDVLEGLRPDQDGLIEIESDKDISTQAASQYLTGTSIGTMGVQDADDVAITGGEIDLDEGFVKITDSNGTVLHQFGS